MRFMKRTAAVVAVGGMFLSVGSAFAADTAAGPEMVTSTQHRVMWLVSPMAGWDKDELQMPSGPPGSFSTETDTGPEYGLFLMMIHPNVVLNNFMFYSKVNDADVSGDLFFANYYYSSKAVFTWNVGCGYLYHLIEPAGEHIEVTAPMVKSGPVLRIPSWHLQLNPYLGYEWERVDTLHTTADHNGSYLYGLTLTYHWRMFEAGVNYYYQDSQNLTPDEDFKVCRVRGSVFFNKNWGLSARVDYAEHETTKDTSFLIGPVFLF